MLTVSSKVLSLSAEAAVLVRGGRLVYANPPAGKLLGSGCVGKSLAELFGREIAEAQAGSFTAEVPVGQTRCIVRTARLDDMQAIFFSPIDLAPNLLNEAFFCSLRGALMNFRLSCELGRARAEKYADRELGESFSTLQRASYRIARLLDNASVVHGIAEGELLMSPTAVDLAALCRSILDSVSALRPDVRFTLYGDKELWLLADRKLLEQLIYNLISNSLVHGAPLSTVTLSLVSSSTQVILSVSDDGCGIGEEKMSYVFERYRAGFELGELGQGAGLGLSVVRGIARLHSGTLMLESRPGGGTAARVSLARKLPAKALCSAEASEDEGIHPLLTGLVDALPLDCFGAKYLD